MTPSRPAALIVEDHPFIGMVASDILRESGFSTFHAYDANDAVQLLDEHPEIEVVVTDADLPGDVDGLELCRRVSRERPDVQLVVTASGPDPLPSEMPEGARVLHKPYASGELRTVVAAKSLLADA
ncbi:MAG TPA: response regulator [Sphingomicrobium sp.]